MTEVVAALIWDGGRFLICQRPEGKHLASLWEFPGGKAEAGESFAECIVRECREELGIEVEVVSLFGETVYDYPEYAVALSFFLCRIISGVPQSKEGQNFCWVSREKLNDYVFCPADRDIVARLMQE